MNKVWKKLSKDITHLGDGASVVFIAVLLMFVGIKDLSKALITAYSIGFLISSIIRLVYFKERPKKLSYNNLFEKVYVSGSFPSNHSVNVGIMLVIFTKYLSNIYLTSVLAIFAITIMSSRIYLKKHHLSDVLIGFLIGVIIGIIVP